MAGTREQQARDRAREVYFDTLRSLGPDEHLLVLAREVEEERRDHGQRRGFPKQRGRTDKSR